MQTENVWADADPPPEGECFTTLLEHNNLVIERIVSSAATAPSESVQSQDEWVVLLKGTAVLKVDGKTVALGSGDYLFLPAGVPHTVERVSQGALWLAVHLHREPNQAGTLHKPIKAKSAISTASDTEP